MERGVFIIHPPRSLLDDMLLHYKLTNNNVISEIDIKRNNVVEYLRSIRIQLQQYYKLYEEEKLMTQLIGGKLNAAFTILNDIMKSHGLMLYRYQKRIDGKVMSVYCIKNDKIEKIDKTDKTIIFD